MKPSTVALLPSALDEQEWIFDRVRGRQVAVFLDYDGTLAPIVQRPEDALLSDRMRDIVRRLAQRCPVTIVSGRDRRIVQSLVGLDTVGYVGSHGFDIRGQVGSSIEREVGTEYLPVLDATEAALRERLAGVEGVLVERKRFTIATHVRRVKEAEWPAVEAVVEAIGRAHPTLQKESGKAVFELRPRFEWDKGAAVLWLLDALGLPRAVPIHLGDDLTDETVFEAICDRGVGIVVADKDRQTGARFALRNTDEVGVFLTTLIDRWAPEP